MDGWTQEYGLQFNYHALVYIQDGRQKYIGVICIWNDLKLDLVL